MESVKLIECPRDAWQGLKLQIPTERKVQYLRALVAAGFRHIDAVSFVSPKAVPQMASYQFWSRTGGGISERGSDSEEVHVRGIADEHGRLMVVMIHNSDIPDAWEREAEDPQYFYRFSPDAYAVGIDIVLYAMTH